MMDMMRSSLDANGTAQPPNNEVKIPTERPNRAPGRQPPEPAWKDHRMPHHVSVFLKAAIIADILAVALACCKGRRSTDGSQGRG